MCLNSGIESSLFFPQPTQLPDLRVQLPQQCISGALPRISWGHSIAPSDHHLTPCCSSVPTIHFNQVYSNKVFVFLFFQKWMCEKNSDQLPLTCPQPGAWPATQAYALRGIEPFRLQENAQPTELHQSGLYLTVFTLNSLSVPLHAIPNAPCSRLRKQSDSSPRFPESSPLIFGLDYSVVHLG